MIDGENIKIDDFGIFLKKNGVVKQRRIDFHEIQKGLISKQRLQKFWYLSFAIGLVVLSISIFWFVKIASKTDITILTHVSSYKPLAIGFIPPLTLGLLGSMIMYSSIRKDWLLILETKDLKKRRINIADVEKKGQLDYFFTILDRNLN